LVRAKRLGVAIFAIVPNSMVDEQTGSTFTWLNSHLRNRQQVKTLIRTVQIQKWYKYDPSVSIKTWLQREIKLNFFLGTCTQEETNSEMA
jgi:hypothetical protein